MPRKQPAQAARKIDPAALAEFQAGLRKRELEPGTFLALRDARIVRDERFRPDLDYRDPVALPPVRAPEEGLSCLARLAILVAAT